MAYYDALIAKWATLTPGTTQQKLDQINALMVTLPATKALLNASQIINAIVPADYSSLTSIQLQQLNGVLVGNPVDGSVGTTVRTIVQQIFAGKTTTLNQLGALVAPFDSPTTHWWQASVAQGGGGLTSMVSQGDLTAAGLS